MVKKFIDYLGFVLGIAVILGIGWLVIEPIIFWTDKSEWRLYCRLFLLLMAVIAFALLRLYNAVVQNTRFEIKLRDSISKITQYFPTLERALHTLSQVLSVNKNSIEALRKAEEAHREEIEKLIEQSKKNSNATIKQQE